MAAFEAWLVFLILVVNVVGELQRKRTLAASRGFLAAARLSCISGVRVRNKTLKQPETVLAFAHDETEIKQNCRRSAETKQPTIGSIVLFQFYFTMPDGL